MFTSSSVGPVRVGIELEALFKVEFKKKMTTRPDVILDPHPEPELDIDHNNGYQYGNKILQSNPQLEDFWLAVEDGSITDLGCEFVMRGPSTFDEYLEAQVYQLLTSLQQTNRMVISPLCGTHIHIDCRDMNKRQLIVFITLSIIMQQVLFGICPKHRRFNNFVSTIEPDVKFVQSLSTVLMNMYNQDTINMHKLSRHIIPNELKYSGLNIWSLTKNLRGSLEFRMFPSTDQPDDIMFWTEILVRMQQAAIRIKGPGSLFVQMNHSKSYTEFVEKIIGKELTHKIISIMKPRQFKIAANKGFVDGIILCNLLNQNLRA